MQQEDSKLAERCADLSNQVKRATAWVNENRDLVRGEYDGLQAELRRSGRFFRKCETAARRKMCVGVFGPSQAGKSYLISALARDDKGTLLADFGGQQRDFITEINPEGGKESTGLVTRFTMSKPASLPPGFPVQIRLLTETDLVKVLANTYYADCEHREIPDAKAISAALDRLQGRMQSAPGRVGLDELEDLKEYLDKDFRAKPRVQELERSFWLRALDIGPRLGLDDRISLYSLIWDEVEPFTQLLRSLAGALESLGHPDMAFCPIEALIPRDNSIIDVAMLQGLESSQSEGTIEVVTGNGGRAQLPRPVVTALTAELTIVMQEKPAEYFEHTDLLDFPGYRSRFKFNDVRAELGKPDILKDMFLRGKVAYLFQRYCAERELTSMLLCIGPSNQEVQDLPGVINDWLLSTHGETPERRLGKPMALYFVLTKFDMEFEQKAGSPSVETRWDNRLHASLLDFFGKQHDWPKIWDGQKAYNNLFLLRNPNFKFGAILEYDAEGKEKCVRSDQQAYVDALESAFLKSPGVRDHFSDPREAWDAAMKFNDGGITRIREKLSPLCNPAIKRQQLTTNLAERLERLISRFKPFWKTDDKEEERKLKAQLSKKLARVFASMVETQKFGEFLHSLGIQDYSLYELYFEAQRRKQQSASEGEADTPQTSVTIGSTVRADDLLGDIFGDDDDEPASETSPGDSSTKAVERHKDEAAHFASLIESHWFEKLHELSDNVVMQRYYAFPGQDFSAFVSELCLGSSRLDLRGRMELALRQAASYANIDNERVVWKQVSLAANLINSYVDWLSYNPRALSNDERTVMIGGRPATLFTPPPRVECYPRLDEEQATFDRQWYADWLRALVSCIMANVDFDGQQTINPEQNLIIGEIINNFSKV